ncbi:sulfite oxidase-like oxidoreductase [Paenibacillus xerothermodurans]|uniref:Sulfite oxidase-like oxidoreductase n=1 Tax=Paenibacillus xerothermodurans TaxID=1977292 RepID=A0A2W1NSL4_PAEXE|nr:sulfite oxidase-like oxidoreductase [Paenibacillus xerothermodurans]PZE20746.1 sulfite oxidase-like oxidoreductase [Paenibacillus xerothermodurans]
MSDDSMSRTKDRVPPGQTVTEGFPVLHYGSVPYYNDMSKWDFRVFGLVEEEATISHKEFMALPRQEYRNDIHCVTTWSKLDNVWEGIPVREVMKRVNLKPEAKFVMLHSEHGFTANLPLEDFMAETSFFGVRHNGQLLTPEHGYPVRMVVPHLYFWKSAKWLRGLEFMEKDKPGFWERNGYHMYGDPWRSQRYDFED